MPGLGMTGAVFRPDYMLKKVAIGALVVGVTCFFLWFAVLFRANVRRNSSAAVCLSNVRQLEAAADAFSRSNRLSLSGSNHLAGSR